MNSAKPAQFEPIRARPEPLRNAHPDNANVVRLLPHGGRQAESYARARLAAPKKVRFLREAIEALARLIDMLVIFAAAKLAALGYLELLLGVERVGDQYFMATLIAAACFGVLMQFSDAYALTHLTSLRWQAKRVSCIWAGVIASLLALAFFSKITETYSRVWVVGWILLTPILLLTGRLALSSVIIRCHQSGLLLRNVAIFGANNIGRTLIDQLHGEPHESVHLVGIFDDRRIRVPGSMGGYDLLGNTDDLVRMAGQVTIDQIIVALPLAATARLHTVLRKLSVLPVDIRLSVEPLVEAVPIKGVETVGSATLLKVAARPFPAIRTISARSVLDHVEVQPRRRDVFKFSNLVKRVIDVVASILLLLLLMPVLLAAAMLIYALEGWPIFYVSRRCISVDKSAWIFKFRTMVKDAASPKHRLKERFMRDGFLDIPQTCEVFTPVGKFLERSQLVEVLQLFNILFHGMSLIGSRPLPRENIELLKKFRGWERRFDSPAGLTGLSQVVGKLNQTPEQRLELECLYSAAYRDPNANILICDICIVYYTMRFVIFGKPLSHEGAKRLVGLSLRK